MDKKLLVFMVVVLTITYFVFDIKMTTITERGHYAKTVVYEEFIINKTDIVKGKTNETDK